MRTAIIDYLDVSHIRTRYNFRSELDLWKPYEETDPDEPGGAIYPHYTFTYDPIGNRLTREATDSSGTIQKEYDANVLNQYETITSPAQALAYDADGNLTDDGSWTYTWDGAGRLVKVEPKGTPVNGSVKVEYAYDYMNRRVSRALYSHNGTDWVGPVVMKYLYHGMQCIGELAGGSITKELYWGLDLAGRLDMADSPFVSFAGAGGVGGLLCMKYPQPTNFMVYNVYDGNGNILKQVDTSGTVYGEYRYGPYGELLDAEDSQLNNPWRYSTKWMDVALAGKGLELVDYGFRWYHAELGRWVSRDLIGEIDGANLYAMLHNTLIHYIDTHGLHLFALEGTSFGYGDRANTQLFYDQTSHPKKYYPGPNVRAGFWNLRKVHNDACKAYCSDKYKGIIPELNFVGWSRGAAGSIVVGYRLDEYGCCCCKGNGETPLYYGSMPLGICINPMWEHHKNIEINFMGLFDAVHMSTIYTPGHFTTNVRAGYHARRTAPMFFHDPAHMVFPQLNTGGIQRDIYRYWDRPATEGIWRKMLIGRFGVFPGAYMTTHGEVGGAMDRLNNDAYCWIVRMALMHNVPINPSALTNAQCREF